MWVSGRGLSLTGANTNCRHPAVEILCGRAFGAAVGNDAATSSAMSIVQGSRTMKTCAAAG